MRGHPSRRTGRAALATAVALALAPAGVAGSHPGHGPVVVSIAEFSYAPESVSVVEGDFVFFSWDGPDTNHSVTADPGQSVAFDSDPGTPPGQVGHKVGDGFSYHFLKPGTYTFHCKVHAFMTGTVDVTPLPDDLKPKPATKPRLTKVSVRRVRLARRHVGVVARYTVNEAVTMRVTLRRRSGKRVKELDFAGPPGRNRRRLDLGRLAAGRYVLAFVAVDSSSGLSTKPVRRRVVVR